MASFGSGSRSHRELENDLRLILIETFRDNGDTARETARKLHALDPYSEFGQEYLGLALLFDELVELLRSESSLRACHGHITMRHAASRTTESERRALDDVLKLFRTVLEDNNF